LLIFDDDDNNNNNNIVVACFVAARNAIVVIIASSMAAVLYHNDVNKFTLTGNITSGIPSFKPPEFTLTHDNHTYTVTDFFEASRLTVFYIEFEQHRTRGLKYWEGRCELCVAL